VPPILRDTSFRISLANALLQIVAAVTSEIMTGEELASFSEETRERVRAVCAIGG
jgi:hypothetical protein